jgi:cell division protein FtsW
MSTGHTSDTRDTTNRRSRAATSTRTRPQHDPGTARGRHPSARPGTKRPPGDRSSTFVGLLVVTTALVLLGLVMVMSAASVSDLRTTGSAWDSFTRQSIFAVMGFAGMFAAFRQHYGILRRLATPLLLVSFGLLVLVLIPGVGVGANGATRWLGAGSLRIQPSELAKLAILIWSARWLALERNHEVIREDPRVLRPVLLALGACAALLLLQPNLGTLIITVGAVGAVILLSGAGIGRLAGWAAVTLGVAASAAMVAPYRRARVLAFLDPWADPSNTGYQTVQSLVGIASGGLTGVGLGASRAKWGFLPYAHTDFIFAIIAEELGLIGALTVLCLFVAIGYFGVRAAMRAPDTFGMLLAGGITAWFVLQAIVNLGAVVGLLPITGVPLPFVSYGGTSLVVNLTAMGVLLSVARQGRDA